jgi:DNA polymerase-4
VTRSQSVETATNDPEVVWPIALDLLRAYDPPRPVRLLGVRLAAFAGEEADPAAGEDEPQLRLTLPG